MNLSDILQRLAIERPVFDLERDFRKALRKILVEELPSAEISSEYNIRNETGSVRIDLRLVHQEQEHFIELKYKPTNLEVEINGDLFQIKHQGAQDLYSYDFWSDVKKLEKIVEFNSTAKGYALFLTNDIRYWIGTEDTGADYYPFRLNDNREVTGSMMWQNNVERKGDDRQSSIKLSGKYRIQWNKFSDVKHLEPKPQDHALYKYLLISV